MGKEADHQHILAGERLPCDDALPLRVRNHRPCPLSTARVPVSPSRMLGNTPGKTEMGCARSLFPPSSLHWNCASRTPVEGRLP
jgi:hypothetical protein